MDNETKLPMNWKPLREAAALAAEEVQTLYRRNDPARRDIASGVAGRSAVAMEVVAAHAALLANLGRPASRLTWVFWLQQQQVEPPPGWTWWEIVSDADSAPALRAALLAVVPA